MDRETLKQDLARAKRRLAQSRDRPRPSGA
jgi:hypothetical protein